MDKQGPSCSTSGTERPAEDEDAAATSSSCEKNTSRRASDTEDPNASALNSNSRTEEVTASTVAADNSNIRSPRKGPTLSTSTSSFEALDPHDPNLSHLASLMFSHTSSYLQVRLILNNYIFIMQIETLRVNCFYISFPYKFYH